MTLHDQLTSERLGRDVSLHVHVPDRAGGARRFPVLYMYDGGAVFRADGFDGARLLETDSSLPPIVLVGIEPPEGRWARTAEFAPYTKAFDTHGADFEPMVRGRGEELLGFVVDELKPWVDRTFPTLPGREDTALGGMSSGALNAAYAVLRRGDVFSRVLLHGPAFNLWLPELLETARDADLSGLAACYMDIGDEDATRMSAKEDTMRSALRMRDEFLARGLRSERLRFTVIPGGKHSPATWRHTFPDALRWVFQDKR